MPVSFATLPQRDLVLLQDRGYFHDSKGNLHDRHGNKVETAEVTEVLDKLHEVRGTHKSVGKLESSISKEPSVEELLAQEITTGAAADYQSTLNELGLQEGQSLADVGIDKVKALSLAHNLIWHAMFMSLKGSPSDVISQAKDLSYFLKGLSDLIDKSADVLVESRPGVGLDEFLSKQYSIAVDRSNNYAEVIEACRLKLIKTKAKAAKLLSPESSTSKIIDEMITMWGGFKAEVACPVQVKALRRLQNYYRDLKEAVMTLDHPARVLKLVVSFTRDIFIIVQTAANIQQEEAAKTRVEIDFIDGDFTSEPKAVKLTKDQRFQADFAEFERLMTPSAKNLMLPDQNPKEYVDNFLLRIQAALEGTFDTKLDKFFAVLQSK